jgi:hypothetical protein
MGVATFLDAEPGDEGQPGAPGTAGAAGATGAQGPTGPSTGLLEQPAETEIWPNTGGAAPVVSVVTQPAVPASTTAVVNKSGVPVTVYVKGGTLTVITVGGVVTGIAAAAAANTAHVIPLAPGQTIAITYTVAPTWVWIGG